jgi:ribonucleoside-diphosphate reductase alpha chain
MGLSLSHTGKSLPVGTEVCERSMHHGGDPQLCQVHRRVPAAALWERIADAQCNDTHFEVVFLEHLPNFFDASANGSINLSQFVRNPFDKHPDVDFGNLRTVASVAIRFLDNVVDLCAFPLKSQEKSVQAARRLGLGLTGVADAFQMLGLQYGSQAGVDLIAEIARTIRDVSLETSIDLAREKGTFKSFDLYKVASHSVVLDLSHKLQDAIAEHGIRNGQVLAIEPDPLVDKLSSLSAFGIAPCTEANAEPYL